MKYMNAILLAVGIGVIATSCHNAQKGDEQDTQSDDTTTGSGTEFNTDEGTADSSTGDTESVGQSDVDSDSETVSSDTGRENSTESGSATEYTWENDCGDGVVQTQEECDDNNREMHDGCSRWCDVERGYTCETLTSGSVCTSVCGDGRLATLNEPCDDGNLEDGDGCDGECQLEEGWICTNISCYPDTTCGDGLRDSRECCDDGNLENGDGCSDRCQIETHVVPDAEVPEECVPMVCGNSIVEPGEECDDGANEGGYGLCGSDCVLGEYCGDGIVQDGYEDCERGEVAPDAPNGVCPANCIIVRDPEK